MARPVIAFLTDFGLRDHYVAAMKGVVLGICPDATLVDISHDIPPQDILAGALELEAVAPYLPEGTVVVGVVDPGVGSGRRAVAIAAGGLRFVGPDNGLFWPSVRDRTAFVAVELTDRRYARPVVSRTFEGRDIFAPASAWLATGVPLQSMGPPVTDLTVLDIPAATAAAGGIDGVVLRVDRFGNLVTNISGEALSAVRSPVEVAIAGALAPVVGTYAEVSPGTLCAMVGSGNRLEISVNGASAAAILGVARGAVAQVRGRARA